MMGRVLLGIAVVLAGLASARPAEARCLPFEQRLLRSSSDASFETRMARHVAANVERFGEVDWRCLMHGFEVLSERTGAEVFRARGTPEGRVYRFVLDTDGVAYNVVFDVRHSQIALVGPEGESRALALE